MNQQASAKGRAFLFQEVGGKRNFLYFWGVFVPVICLMYAWLLSTIIANAPPVQYMDEPYCRGYIEGAESVNKRRRAEAQKVIDARSKTRLTRQDVEALVGFANPDWRTLEVSAMVEICWRESRFYALCQNPRSSAFGLYQFLDSTWGSIKKTDDPLLQTLAASRYIEARYTTPTKALSFHDKRGYY